MSQRIFNTGGLKNIWGQMKATFKAESEEDHTESEEDHTESEEDNTESEEGHMKVSRTPMPFHASPLILIPNTFT